MNKPILWLLGDINLSMDFTYRLGVSAKRELRRLVCLFADAFLYMRSVCVVDFISLSSLAEFYIFGLTLGLMASDSLQ